MTMGSFQELTAEFRKADSGCTGVVDVACLYSVLRSSMSAEQFLGLIVTSGACYVHYEEFLNWLDTGRICQGLESPKANNMVEDAAARLRRDYTRETTITPDLYSQTSSHTGTSSANMLQPSYWSCVADLGSLPSKTEKHRLMLTGATGLLGREVYKVFCKSKQWVVCGIGLSRATGPILQLDLFDTAEFCRYLDDFKPDVLVHCVGERNPDKIQGNETWAKKINCDLTRSIGNECALRNIWMVHISTNYVFDGKAAPYAEDAKPSPMNTYGRSKMEGEVALAEAHPGAAILRIPLLYGPSKLLGESPVTQLLQTVKQPLPRLCNWQERYPTYTPDLAQVIHAFAAKYIQHPSAESAPQSFSGIFHWQAQEMYTKYGMAKVIADLAGADTAAIVPVDSPAVGSAPRPQFEQMLCNRIDGLLGVDRDAAKPAPFFTGFAPAVKKVLKPFINVVEETPHEIY